MLIPETCRAHYITDYIQCFTDKQQRNNNLKNILEKFEEDTKEVIKRRKYKKEIHCYGQRKRDEMTNNDLQNTIQNTID